MIHAKSPSLRETLQIVAAAFPMLIRVRYVRPAIAAIHRALPHRLALQRLVLVGRRSDGAGWYRIPATGDSRYPGWNVAPRGMRALRHVEDIQSPGSRGFASLWCDELLLIDGDGQVLGHAGTEHDRTEIVRLDDE